MKWLKVPLLVEMVYIRFVRNYILYIPSKVMISSVDESSVDENNVGVAI